MKGFEWLILFIIVLLVILPIIGIFLLAAAIMKKAKIDGFCYHTDSTFDGQMCSIMNKEDCAKHKDSKHFDTSKECNDYMNSQTTENYGCCN